MTDKPTPVVTAQDQAQARADADFTEALSILEAMMGGHKMGELADMIATGLRAARAEGARAAEREVERLTAELEEHEQSFALYDEACRDATKWWRAEDPEHRQMVLPDTRALVRWLLENWLKTTLDLVRVEAEDRQLREAIAGAMALALRASNLGAGAVDATRAANEGIALATQIEGILAAAIRARAGDTREGRP